MVGNERIIKFTTIEWLANWEFDRPIVILEPYIRYGFHNGEDLVEDLALTIAMDKEHNETTEDEDISREFAWRGWSIELLKGVVHLSSIIEKDEIKIVAKTALPYNGEKSVIFKVSGYLYEFYDGENGEIEFREIVNAV